MEYLTTIIKLKTDEKFRLSFLILKYEFYQTYESKTYNRPITKKRVFVRF